MRKAWDDYYMDVAFKIAERSTCNRLAVGAVVVKHHRIVSTGYNGSIHGHPHCTDVGCLTNEEGRCIRTIHSEINAILHANREDLKDSTIYCTHKPCENCMKHINQAGITRVIYRHDYPNKWSSHFEEGMEVLHHDSQTQVLVEEDA